MECSSSFIWFIKGVILIVQKLTNYAGLIGSQVLGGVSESFIQIMLCSLFAEVKCGANMATPARHRSIIICNVY